MTRESLFYKILSAIHIVFFTSILFFITIILSGTLLFMPALGAIFLIGKDVIYKVININDSIIKTYMNYLRYSLKLFRFAPVNIIVILNVVGMIVTADAKNMVYSVMCLGLVAFLLIFMFYIAGYFVFINKEVDMIEVAIIMFAKLQFLIPVFAGMVCCVFFFSNTLLIVLLFTGTFFMFAIEVVIFIQMLFYKKIVGNLDENDEFAYIVNRQKAVRQNN